MAHPKPQGNKLGRHRSLADQAKVELEAIPHYNPAWDFGDLGRLKHKTRQWLIAVLSSPQAALFQSTDVQRIRDLLILKDAFYGESDPEMLIKLQRAIKPLEDSLLFSHVDRSKVGIKIQPAEQKPESTDPTPNLIDEAFE